MLRPSWLSAEELRESLPFLLESQMQISKHVLVATHLSSCPPFESNSAVFCWADLWQRNPATGYRVGPLEKITWTLDRKQSIISIYAKCITRFLFLAMVSETGKEKSFFVCLFEKNGLSNHVLKDSFTTKNLGQWGSTCGLRPFGSQATLAQRSPNIIRNHKCLH